GKVELGPALVLRRADRGDRARRDGCVLLLPALPLRAAARRASRGPGARAAGRAGGSARASARLGNDGRARRDDGGEHLLSDDAVLLLLRVRGARARAAARFLASAARVRVVVLTTSYPRWEGDAAGRFVADAVERLRDKVDVEVVSAQSFRHFGIAYGHGVLGNLKRRPWLGALMPMFLASFVHAARDAARDADLVHAHWLPAGWVAARTGKPFAVTLHGPDVELADRLPAFARAVLRRARVVIAVSSAIAERARGHGAADVRVIPNGVDEKATGEESDPPFVLYAGRLSDRKSVV